MAHFHHGDTSHRILALSRPRSASSIKPQARLAPIAVSSGASLGVSYA